MDLRPDLKTKKQVRLRTTGNCRICDKPIATSVLTGWLKLSPVCHCDKSQNADLANTGDPNRSNPSDFERPDLGPDFELLELLGQGGMGQVFKVRNKIDGSILAVKVLKSELADDKEALKRFAQEIHAVSNLDHENIIAVHSQGATAAGAPYLVMDFVEGLNLGESLKQNVGISDDDAIQIFSDLAKALESAHAGGILHRDLKPSNVMLTETVDGSKSAKLADFGIAKLMPSESTIGRETSDLTKTGDIFGTPGYMSPEQCLGFKLDERSDIYSLGCLMYEILSGSSPFAAENPIQIVIKQINDQAPPWISARGGTFGKKMEAIVLKCLEKQPEKRYQSAREIIDELERLRSGKKVSAPIHVKEKKAHLTKLQFVGLFFFSTIIFAFATTTLAGGDLNMLNMFIWTLPFTAGFLYKNRRRFVLPQTEAVQWILVRSCIGVALGLLAILLLPWTLGCLEWLPDFIQFIPVFTLGAIFFLVMVFVATMIAELFGGQEKRVTLKTICKKSILPVVIGLVPFALMVPQGFQEIAERMVHGLSYLETLTSYKSPSPKFANALLQSANLIRGKNDNGVLLEAQILMRFGKPAEAIKILTEGIAKYKMADDLVRERALAYCANNESEKAISDLKRLEGTTVVYSSRTGRRLGEVYFKVGDFKNAIETYTTAIEKSPYNSGPLYEARAAAKWRSGLKDAAIHDLSKAYAQRSAYDEPENILIQRAICYEQLGDSKAALKDFSDAKVKMARNDGNYDMGPLLLGRLQEAPGMSERCADEIFKRAFVNQKLGNVEKSKQYFRDAAMVGANKNDFLADFKEKFAIKEIW